MSGKTIRLLLWGLVSINVVALLWVGVVSPRIEARAAGSIGRGDYALQVTDGGTFTEASLQSGPSVVFFGFTHCPEVCPTTLGDILTWQEELGPDQDELNVYFVTVDPERDTADILGDYVGWVPGVVGVTGTAEDVDKALDSFKVYAAKVALDDGDYTMDHSASVLLFDRAGNYSDRVMYQEAPEIAVGKLRKLLDS